MKICKETLYTTKEVANILKVSDLTIKRYIASKKISSIKFNGLRRINGDEITRIINLDQKNSTSKHLLKQGRHPKHYKLHRYWGRKSSDLVSHYISKYTNKGDTVLDPFMGSGVTVIESNKLERSVYGIDINPLSKLIVEGTLIQTDLGKLEKCFNEIIQDIPKELLELNHTISPNNNVSEIVSWIWDNDSLSKIRGYNSIEGEFVKIPDKQDLMKLKKALKFRKSDKFKITYPTEKLLKFVRRSGKKTTDELFSDHNLLILGFIIDKINAIPNKKYRTPLKLIFSSSLVNASLMIPADTEKARGKSGWQISKIWVPKTHIEKNVVLNLQKKIKEYIEAKNEIDPLLSDTQYHLKTQSAEKLNNLKTSSINYIFTDPPYGDTIAYLGLNMFWNAWVSPRVSYKKEIIYDTYRKKGYTQYYEGLQKSYSEMSRVLKKDHYMTFTFNARNLRFWKIIIDATLDSGFEVQDVNWVDQAASSGTQGINKRNTLKGDFVYTFKNVKKSTPNKDCDGTKLLISTTKNLISKNLGFIEVHKLYENLMPLIIKKRAFLDGDEIMDIEKILKHNFEYMENSKNGKILYGWVEKTINKK